MSTAKSIVSDILAYLRLDRSNYDSWRCKIKYLLSENDVVNFITREVGPQRGAADTEVQQYANEVKKD